MALIKDGLKEIVDELRNVRDIRHVPDEPPEGNDRFPFAVVYPESGLFQKESAGFMTNLHNVNIEFHVARKDLPRDYRVVVDLLDRIPNQLEEGLEAGRFTAISTWENISYDFSGDLSWAGVPTIGIVFTMNNVKLHDTVTT